MQIDERTVENVMILDLKGKLISGNGDALLKDKIHSLVYQGHKQVLLNFGDLSYVDSPGIGEILAGYTTVSRAGSLKLLNLTKRIPDLLAITKLLVVFETYQGEQEAVGSFSSPVDRVQGERRHGRASRRR